MKRLIFLIGFTVLSSSAQARVAGKLDLYSDPQAIVLRDLMDGLWLVGLQKNVWKLMDVKRNREVLHVSFFVASRLEGQTPTYGPSVGTNVGPLVSSLAEKLSLLSAVSDATPPWLAKIANWTSIDFYGGYRPDIGTDLDARHWMYGVGGQIRIPFGEVAKWARGSRNDGTPDKKGL